VNKIKNMKHIKEFNESEFELLGPSLDKILDAVNILKITYGKDNIKIFDKSGHQSGDNFSVYIKFSSDIELYSDNSNIIREINYILEQEESKVKIYKTN